MLGSADNVKIINLKMGKITLHTLAVKSCAVRVHLCEKDQTLKVMGRAYGTTWDDNAHSMNAAFITDLGNYMRQRQITGFFYLQGEEYAQINQRYERNAKRARPPM